MVSTKFKTGTIRSIRSNFSLAVFFFFLFFSFFFFLFNETLRRNSQGNIIIRVTSNDFFRTIFSKVVRY